MKLYTEEQIRQIFENLSTWTGYDYIMETYSDSLIPIELPSDEEIDNHFDIDINGKAISYGAKWMKEQIINQNK